MSDYIKREDAIYCVKSMLTAIQAEDIIPATIEGALGYLHKVGWMQEHDRIMTEDAVPVVRCKDCKYWDKDTLRHNSNDVAEWDECECEMLARRDGWNEIDRYCCGLHFCADGERKDDE